MFVKYAPEDGAGAGEWEFDSTRVRSSVAERIEVAFGEPYDVWFAAVQQGSTRARRVLLWYLISLEHPAHQLRDTPDFMTGELKLSYGVAELVAARDRLLKANLPTDKREQALAAVDVEMVEAMAREGDDTPAPVSEDAEGKGE